MYDQHSKVLATIQMLGKQGNLDEVQKLYASHQDDAYNLQSVHETIGNLNHEIQMIYQMPLGDGNNGTMTKADKRQLIDNYYYMMITAAHQGVEAFKQMNLSLKSQTTQSQQAAVQ